jgi:hypothetical protein
VVFERTTGNKKKGIYCYTEKYFYHFAENVRGKSMIHKFARWLFDVSYWVLEAVTYLLAEEYLKKRTKTLICAQELNRIQRELLLMVDPNYVAMHEIETMETGGLSLKTFSNPLSTTDLAAYINRSAEKILLILPKGDTRKLNFLSFGKSNTDTSVCCYMENDIYYFHEYGCRESEDCLKSTRNLFEITYWALRTIVYNIPRSFRNYRDPKNMDLRRFQFPWECALLAAAGENYAQWHEIQFAGILKTIPYNDTVKSYEGECIRSETSNNPSEGITEKTSAFTFKEAVREYVTKELKPLLLACGFTQLEKDENIFVREKHYMIQQIVFIIENCGLTVCFSHEPVVTFRLSVYSRRAKRICISEGIEPWVTDSTARFENHQRVLVPKLQNLKEQLRAEIDALNVAGCFKELIDILGISEFRSSNADRPSYRDLFEEDNVVRMLYECAEGDFEKGKVMLREYHENLSKRFTLEESGLTGEALEYTGAYDLWTSCRENSRILYVAVQSLNAKEGKRVFIEKLDEITAKWKKEYNETRKPALPQKDEKPSSILVLYGLSIWKHKGRKYIQFPPDALEFAGSEAICGRPDFMNLRYENYEIASEEVAQARGDTDELRRLCRRCLDEKRTPVALPQ